MVKAQLDESQFCRQCSPEIKEPKLILNLQLVGDTAPRRIEGVTAFDLQLLDQFLRGADKIDVGQDRERALRDFLPRLQELLGVKAE